MRKGRYALLVFLGGCSFGVLSTLVKLAYAAGFSTSTVSGSQFLFGTLLIWFVALFTTKKKLTRSEIGKLLLFGTPMGLTGVFYYNSLQTLDASLAIIFLFQFIWIGSLIEWIIYKRRPSKVKLYSIILCLAGSLLASGVFVKAGTDITVIGSIWGLLAAFSFSTFIFASSSVSQDIPSIQRSALLSTGGTIIVLFLFPPTFLFNSSELLGVLPYGLFLALFGVVFPPLLFTYGMPHIGVGLGAILSAAELPVAVMLSAIVLVEKVNLVQWFGVVLILVGIVAGHYLNNKDSTKYVSS